MAIIDGLGLGGLIGAFLLAAAVIGLAGTAMAGLADRLADRTGLGEALMGGLLLGGCTSLPGVVTSITAAAGGHPDLAMANALGGIAVQTFFLAIADIAYRRSNLEHAAASLTNLTQGAVLVTLLSVPLLAAFAPPVQVFGVHPATLGLFLLYGFGMRVAAVSRADPMWGPERTDETEVDEPDEPAGDRRTIAGILARVAGLAAVLAGAGYLTAETAVAVADRTGIAETVIGGLMTAIATSLPELVTTIAAVRRGALTLAVGGIIGGNTFDVLFIAFSDIAYRDGSIYHAVSDQAFYFIGLNLLMTSVVLLGLLRRERHGLANIGFESVALIAVYVGSVVWLVLAG